MTNNDLPLTLRLIAKMLEQGHTQQATHLALTYLEEAATLIETLTQNND